MKRGKLRVVEGPDLGGKDTILDEIISCYLNDNKIVFDVVRFWKQQQATLDNVGRDPTIDEIFANGVPDVVVYSEPSYVLDGVVLRQDALRLDRPTPETVAQIARYFAEDRKRIFTNVVDYVLKAGVDALSGRNIQSSDVYQPLQYSFRTNVWNQPESSPVTRASVRNLSGNQFCLEPSRLPDFVLLAFADGEELIRRRDLRSVKLDGVEVERDEFLMALAPAYRNLAPEFCKQYGVPFETKEVIGTVEDTRAFARDLYQREFVD